MTFDFHFFGFDFDSLLIRYTRLIDKPNIDNITKKNGYMHFYLKK